MFGTFLIIFVLFNIVSTLIVLGACAVSGANEHVMEKALLDKIEQKDIALQRISSARQHIVSAYAVALPTKSTAY